MSSPHRPWIAFTRAVSPTIVDCELTHLARTPIRVDVVRAQHAEYEQLLVALGCDMRRVAPAPDHPDAVFIEDTAVVLDEIAVLMHPGAPARRAEVAAVEDALGALRPLGRITAPATMDGGDVLVVGRTVFAGVSQRTNADGVEQLRSTLAPFGYAVRAIRVRDCLHLKSAVTALDEQTVLLNPALVDPAEFAGYRVVAVDPTEPMAANVLRLGAELVYGASNPRTLDRLRALGFAPHTVDASELAKAEGAVTCCSLILRA